MIRETLWRLAGRILDIEARIEEQGGAFVDANGDFDPAFEAEFDALSEDFGEKMRQCREYRMTLEHNQKQNADEARRLSAAAQHQQRLAEALERYMAQQLVRLGLKKFALPDGSVTWTVSATRGRTVIDDLELIPESCLVPQPPKPDLAMVRELIERGHLLGGAHVVPGISLRER